MRNRVISMSKMLLCIAATTLLCVGCTNSSDESSHVDGVTGPGGVTVSAPVANQLVVSWTADPLSPFKYYVYQSAGGGTFSLVASVLNASAVPPAPTSWTAFNLSGGVNYCYEIQSAYIDGTTSDIGIQGCGTVVGPPADRSGFGVAFNSASDIIYMFGGISSGQLLSDMWSWNGTSWIPITSITGPSNRSQPAMTYDRRRNVIVLFGGQLTTGFACDTWEWDATDGWVQRITNSSPSCRADADMSFNPLNMIVEMRGGTNSTGQIQDSWTWNGLVWQQLP